MDKLEEHLFDEFNSPTAYELKNKPGFEYEKYLAHIAAKICLEVAEKSFNAGVKYSEDIYWTAKGESFEDFKKEIL